MLPRKYCWSYTLAFYHKVSLSRLNYKQQSKKLNKTKNCKNIKYKLCLRSCQSILLMIKLLQYLYSQ